MQNLNEPIIHYVFTWHTGGFHPCRECQALDGRQYRDQDLFAPVLIDPEFGPIWHLDGDFPLTHPDCQCYLHVEVESVDLGKLEELASLNRFLEVHF